jgi:sulfopyruvate decarboxylase TPP-binding subunit
MTITDSAGERRAHMIWEQLTEAGIEHLVWIPDSETHFMHGVLERPSSDIRVVQVCREGEAFGVCAGLYLGGARGALVIENQGMFDSGNILKWAIGLQLPIVALVGYVHYHKMQVTNGVRTVAGARDVTEPFLQAFEMPYVVVDSDADVPLIGQLARRAFDERRPVVALLTSADDYTPGT